MGGWKGGPRFVRKARRHWDKHGDEIDQARI